MSIGSELQQAREQQGLTLRDLSERTKIRGAVLRAIEQNQFDPAIGVVIMRGFLKLYAREVGLDPVDIARRYEEVAGMAASGQASEGLGGSHAGRTTPSQGRAGSGRVAVAAVMIVVLVGAVYVWQRAAPPPAAEPVTDVAGRVTSDPAPSPPAAPTPAPVVTPAPPEAPPVRPAETTALPASQPASQPVADGMLRVEMAATGETWLAATADGRQVAYRVLNPGERLTIDLKDEAVLRIGAPGNLAVTINGRPVRPSDRPSSPTTLRITPDTYRSLLAQ